MRSWITKGVATAAMVAMLAGPAFASGSWGYRSDRQVAVGLAGNGTQLLQFDVTRPRKVTRISSVRGLSGDQSLIGIDYRVQDGMLYGVGNQGGVYTLSARNARATKVSQLSIALQGTSFGVDFNPAANRLRVISDTGQNLRHNIDDGATAGTTLMDGTLTYPPATTPATGVTAAAYTNNDLDPTTATTLFDLDTMMDQVAIQSPANAGSLAPTGMLGVDAGADAGFDIYSKLRMGKTVSVTGYAVLNVGRKSSFYRVNMITGEAANVGNFSVPVTDVAVPLSS
jgi:hypothetical protein